MQLNSLRTRVYGVGVDLVPVARIEAAITSPTKQRFFDRVYTEGEIAEYNLRQSSGVSQERAIQYLASRFALKEATYKALSPQRITWRDTTLVVVDGRYCVDMTAPGLQDAIKELGVTWIHASVSHEADFAIATVTVEVEC